MFHELLFAPRKNKNKAPRSQTEMETSILPQARFLLGSKANCWTQKTPGSPISLCYTQYFLRDLKKALWLYTSWVPYQDYSSEKLRNTSKRPPEKVEASVLYLILSLQIATLQAETSQHASTANICLVIHLLFFSTDTFKKKCSGWEA